MKLNNPHGTLRILCNVTNAVDNYYQYLKDEIFCTDLMQDLNATIPLPDEDTTIKKFRQKFPIPIGQYLSSRDVWLGEIKDFSPRRAVEKVLDGFSDSDFLPITVNPGYAVADYKKLSVMLRMVDKIVAKAIYRRNRYGINVLYTDNWSYFATDDNGTGLPGWSYTLLYMTLLYNRLKAEGITFGTNIAIVPGDFTESFDRRTFECLACDFVTLEMPAVPAVFSIPEGVTNWVNDYRTMTSRGVTPILIPRGETLEALNADADFLAGCAMLLGSVYVAHSFWIPPQRWHHWIKELGSPVSGIEYLTKDFTVMKRDFSHGTVTVDLVQRRTELIKK